MRFAGRAVRNSEFLRGVMIIGLGSVVAQLLPVLLTPFITRIYSPHDVGMLGLYTSFIGFASGALALGYPQAIVSAQDNKEAAQLLVLSGILILPSTVLASSLLWALHHFSLLGFGELPLMAVPWLCHFS
jgi:O-antigen/teichoic acid export membrane protein